jgi:hypothetical protein
MANTFTATKSFSYAGPGGRTIFERIGTLVIDTTANGGAVDGDLPATMFDLVEIIGGSATADDNSKVFSILPSYDADSALVGFGASNAPMDLPNDTYLCVIRGF